MANEITLHFKEKEFEQQYCSSDSFLKEYHLGDNVLGDDFLQAVKDNLEYLESHNKNYTNKQYHIIADLADIFKFMEVSYKED
jgi:hypothetical protein